LSIINKYSLTVQSERYRYNGLGTVARPSLKSMTEQILALNIYYNVVKSNNL